MLGDSNPHNFQSPATIDSPYDYNRDQRVNALDMLIVRNNQTHFLDALEQPAIAESELVENDSTSLDWLHEFDPQDDNQADDKNQTDQAVDDLMEVYSS